MRSKWAAPSLLVILQFSFAASAWAIECSRPPGTTLGDSKAEFDIAVLNVLKLRGPSIAGAVQSQSRSLLEKLPNADRTLVDLTYMYTLCTALRDDRSLPEREKGRLLAEYVRALQPNNGSSDRVQAPASKPPAPRATPTAPSAPASSKPTTSVSGNTGPVLIGNDVKGDLNISTTGK